MFTYNEFLSEYKIPVPPWEFAIVFDAVPSGVKMLLSSITSDTVPPISLPELYLRNSDPFLSTKQIINVSANLYKEMQAVSLPLYLSGTISIFI